MGRLKYVFLPFIFFMAFYTLPLAAPDMGAAAGAAPCLAEQMNAPPNEPCEGCKEKHHRSRGIDDGAAFRVYSMITGRTQDELKSACEESKLTIWELARRDGRLDTLKAKLLEGHAAGLDALVKSGVMTPEQKSKILAHIKDDLGKQ